MTAYLVPPFNLYSGELEKRSITIYFTLSRFLFIPRDVF